MEQLLRDGKVRRGWIGVEPRDLSAELAESLNLAVRQGVLITGVLQNGPAAQGGLRPGDVVVQVGDRPVRNVGELFGAVAALPPEQDAVVVAQRGDEQLRLKDQGGRAPQPRRSRRGAETAAPASEQQRQPLQDQHRKEAKRGQHRPLDDDQAALPPDHLAGADVDGETQQAADQQQPEDKAKDQHGVAARADGYQAGASSAKPRGASVSRSKVTTS